MALKDNPDLNFEWTITESCAHKYLFKTIKNIFSRFKIAFNSNILDAGCGSGFIDSNLHLHGYKNIWGFDNSDSGIKLAKNTYASLQDRFFIHNAYEENLPDALQKIRFDVVLSVEVIEHLYSPKIYLENIKRWLNKDGLLILTTPYHGYLKNLLISLVNKSDWHFNPLHESGHIKFFSKKTLFEILSTTGFKPLKFYGSCRVPFLWKSMVIVGQKL